MIQVAAAPKCAACKEPLSGQTAAVGGSEFHLACFKCMDCGKKLGAVDGGRVLAVGNMPYCDSCGKKAFIRSVCFITYLTLVRHLILVG